MKLDINSVREQISDLEKSRDELDSELSELSGRIEEVANEIDESLEVDDELKEVCLKVLGMLYGRNFEDATNTLHDTMAHIASPAEIGRALLRAAA